MAEVGKNSDRQAKRHDRKNRGREPQTAGGAGEPAPASVPRGLRSPNPGHKKKLVLHVDLNNTILVSDAVTSQGTVSALDGFLATVTWGRMSRHGNVRTHVTCLICVTSAESDDTATLLFPWLSMKSTNIL